jgi:hypothetical protein
VAGVTINGLVVERTRWAPTEEGEHPPTVPVVRIMVDPGAEVFAVGDWVHIHHRNVVWDPREQRWECGVPDSMVFT